MAKKLGDKIQIGYKQPKSLQRIITSIKSVGSHPLKTLAAESVSNPLFPVVFLKKRISIFSKSWYPII